MTTILDIPGTNPPNPFSTPIQAFLTASSTSESAAHETAAHIVTTVTTSRRPTHALWELWDAFFTAVVTSSSSTYLSLLLSLLDAIHTHPPTQHKLSQQHQQARSSTETSLHSYTQATGTLQWSTLPRFSAQWRDVHDILQAWRDWDGVRVGTVSSSSNNNKSSSITTNSTNSTSIGSSAGEYYLRFCVFSAALLKEKNKMVHPVWVFLASRDVLEREREVVISQPRQPKLHRMTPEQLWTLDVRVAATWMRDGGQVLWETDDEQLRLHWAAALDTKTELWPRNAGLTLERWLLWGERLQELSTEGNLDEETRKVVTEAAEVVQGLLKKKRAEAISQFA